MVRFFWLPFYLSQYYSPQISNLVSIVYDLGMIPGGILVGFISDFYRGRRACVIGTFTLTLVPFISLFSQLTKSSTAPTIWVFIVLGIIGSLIGGPINIITSAVAIDLAEHSSIGGRSDLMMLTGVINGCGSIIASLGLLLIGPIVSSYGWDHVWKILIYSTVIGTLLLSPAIIKELRRAPFESASDENDDFGPGLEMNGSNDLTESQTVPSHSAMKTGNGTLGHKHYLSTHCVESEENCLISEDSRVSYDYGSVK